VRGAEVDVGRGRTADGEVFVIRIVEAAVEIGEDACGYSRMLCASGASFKTTSGLVET